MNLINYNKQLLTRLCASSLRLLSMRSMTTIEDNYVEEVIKNERLFEDLTPKQFSSLAQNENQLNEIELILSQYQYIKYSSLEVPTTLTHKHMEQLLQLQSKSERNKYFNYLFKSEIKRLVSSHQKLLHKELKHLQLTDKWKLLNAYRAGIFNKDNNIVYGLWHNSLFTRISPQHLTRYRMHRLRNASLFGQNIVFDLSNIKQMSRKVCNSVVNQITKSYAINRNKFSDPFNLHFCNIDYESIIWKTIEQRFNFINRLDSYVNYTQRSYLDVFEDKSKLVYISSKADKLLNFDPNCVYILGFCEKNDPKPIITVKGKQENIEVQRLPIDEHVLWNFGSKDLHFNEVLSILYDVRNGVNWLKAFQNNIKPKHIKTPEMVAKEEALKLEKLRNKFFINPIQKLDVKQIFED